MEERIESISAASVSQSYTSTGRHSDLYVNYQPPAGLVFNFYICLALLILVYIIVAWQMSKEKSQQESYRKTLYESNRTSASIFAAQAQKKSLERNPNKIKLLYDS